MKNKRLWLALTGVLALSSGLAMAASPDAEEIAQKGNGDGALACTTCHGDDGMGQPAAGFPRLAGQNPAYITKQIKDFASGERENAVMKPIASALKDEEIKALADFYSKKEIKGPASDKSQEDNLLGEKLALRGDWDKNVPACVQCHGPQGVGVGEHFPGLSGQGAKYISNELHAWKDGKRHNDPLELMRHVASALDDDEIEAVSEWFAAQSATLEEQGD